MDQNTRAYYMNLAREAARRYGVPEDLFISLIEQESGFDPTAQSPKGAYGLTQLMPATAEELGVDPRDIEQNLAGGARYLNQMMTRFPDLNMALAAYNAGPTRVAELGRVPNYPETQNYIKGVLGRLPDNRPRNMPLQAKMTERKPDMIGGKMGGLFGRMMKRNEMTGLNPLENIAASLDPLIHPQMRAGASIRQQGLQRAQYGRQQATKNATIEELKRIANGTGSNADLARELLGAVNSGAMTPADAYKALLAQTYDMSGDKIRSTVKFKNGAYYVVTDKGRKVYDREGNFVPSGPKSAEVLREAELSGIAMEGVSTGTSEAAKFQQKFAAEAFEKAGQISSQIATIDRAIAEIDAGAKRNVIMNLLPDISAQAGGLTAALRQMGLDVVSSVTFGALSQSELDIAMSTAYPPNANEVELRKFLVKRRDALKKLRTYTEEAASFLRNPNNTTTMWMDIVKSRRDQQASQGMQNPFMGMTLEQLNQEYARYPQMTEMEKTQFRDALNAFNQSNR